VDSPATKQCGQCGAVHPATNDHFGTDNSQADSLRKICKHCYSDNRYGDKTKAVQALRVHDKMVAKARKELAENLNNLSAGQIEKYNRIVRLDGEHRAEIQKKIQDARKAEELAQQQAAAAPSLTLVQSHFGSPILLTVDEMRDKLARATIALGNLTDESDGPAREHVEAYIKRVALTVEQHDEREAEKAKDAQETLNESVCRRVIGRVHDLYLPQIRAANTVESKIALRENMRARKKALLAMAKTATGKDKNGAERAVVAKAVGDALEKLALMCYGAKAELPSDSLENLQSRVDSANAAQEELEKIEAERQQYWSDLKERDPKMWEKESRSLVLQIKGEGPFADIQRKSMAQLKRENPALYEQRALDALKPRTVVPQQIIYVVMEGKREIFYWPDGELVKKGEEITFDFRLRRWCLMPGPASIDLEPVTANGRQRMELNQHDDGSFHWEPEGSQGTYTQGRDGLWTKDAGGVSPWTKAEKITFQRAEPPASSAHIHLRHGKWFTQAEVDEAARADAANPPNLLPPLPRFAVADSLALPPAITARDREKDSKEPSVWKRWEAKQREEKEREAELLQGNQI
jgi:hypothetical protein